MGWDIRIGNAVKAKDDDGNVIDAVEHARSKDAPTFNGAYDDDNRISPSYSGFHWFCCECSEELASMFDRLLFFDHKVTPICRGDLNNIRSEIEIRRAKGQSPGFGESEDDVLARLLWFEFWFQWALDNCERPAIETW